MSGRWACRVRRCRSRSGNTAGKVPGADIAAGHANGDTSIQQIQSLPGTPLTPTASAWASQVETHMTVGTDIPALPSRDPSGAFAVPNPASGVEPLERGFASTATAVTPISAEEWPDQGSGAQVATEPAARVDWQFCDKDGAWYAMSDNDSRMLEERFKVDPTSQLFLAMGSRGFRYFVDLPAMTQTSSRTGHCRRIRRAWSGLIAAPTAAAGSGAAAVGTAATPPPKEGENPLVTATPTRGSARSHSTPSRGGSEATTLSSSMNRSTRSRPLRKSVSREPVFHRGELTAHDLMVFEPPPGPGAYDVSLHGRALTPRGAACIGQTRRNTAQWFTAECAPGSPTPGPLHYSTNRGLRTTWPTSVSSPSARMLSPRSACIHRSDLLVHDLAKGSSPGPGAYDVLRQRPSSARSSGNGSHAARKTKQWCNLECPSGQTSPGLSQHSQEVAIHQNNCSVSTQGHLAPPRDSCLLYKDLVGHDLMHSTPPGPGAYDVSKHRRAFSPQSARIGQSPRRTAEWFVTECAPGQSTPGPLDYHTEVATKMSSHSPTTQSAVISSLDSWDSCILLRDLLVHNRTCSETATRVPAGRSSLSPRKRSSSAGHVGVDDRVGRGGFLFSRHDDSGEASPGRPQTRVKTHSRPTSRVRYQRRLPCFEGNVRAEGSSPSHPSSERQPTSKTYPCVQKPIVEGVAASSGPAPLGEPIREGGHCHVADLDARTSPIPVSPLAGPCSEPANDAQRSPLRPQPGYRSPTFSSQCKHGRSPR